MIYSMSNYTPTPMWSLEIDTILKLQTNDKTLVEFKFITVNYGRVDGIWGQLEDTLKKKKKSPIKLTQLFRLNIGEWRGTIFSHKTTAIAFKIFHSFRKWKQLP